MKRFARIFTTTTLAMSMLFSLTACPTSKEATPVSTVEQAEEERPAAPEKIADADQWLDENGNFKVCDFFESYGWTAEAEGDSYVAEKGTKCIILRTGFHPMWWLKDNRIDHGGLLLTARYREATEADTFVDLDNSNSIVETLLALLQDYLAEPKPKKAYDRINDYRMNGGVSGLHISAWHGEDERWYSDPANHEADKAAVAAYAEVLSSIEEDKWLSGDKYDIVAMMAHYGWELAESGEDYLCARMENAGGLEGKLQVTVDGDYGSFELYCPDFCYVAARSVKSDGDQIVDDQIQASPELLRALEEVLCVLKSHPGESHEIFISLTEKYLSGVVSFDYESRMS